MYLLNKRDEYLSTLNMKYSIKQQKEYARALLFIKKMFNFFFVDFFTFYLFKLLENYNSSLIPVSPLQLCNYKKLFFFVKATAASSQIDIIWLQVFV